MKVGIIGAGTMGAGIAQAFAMTDGYEVCLCDIKQEFADGGKAKIQKNINFLVGKEKISAEKGEEIMGKIVTGLKDICTDCDLVIEVCPESMAIKKQTFAELQQIVKKDCIFSTRSAGVLAPAITSTSFILSAGLKKCIPIRGRSSPLPSCSRS